MLDLRDDEALTNTLGESGIVTLPTAFNGAKEGHNHIALENASKIIHLFYGEEYGITIQSRQGIGTIAQQAINYGVSNYEYHLFRKYTGFSPKWGCCSRHLY